MIPNANLRELRAQATRWAYIQDWKTHNERQNLEARRYGELILRECLLRVADVRIENDFEPVADAALVKAIAGIKEYFGVEE